MKKLILIFMFLILVFLSMSTCSFAEVRWVRGYYRENGTYVTGHYRDVSGDGNPFNNAEYLGY